MRLPVVLLLVIISLLCGGGGALAQGTIAGAVVAGGAPVAVATVSLLHAPDSSWLRTELADDSGAFVFKDVPAGTYILSVTAIGFATAMQQVLAAGAVVSFTIELHKQDASLGEVTVTGKKPFMEMSLGKLTVNVEGSPTAAGANALELLRRLPGLTVGPAGAISMQGKQGVLVLIDERPTYLSADQLAEYLKTITAAEIAQLELITQPGAKYDAAGNTGVINIKLRKSARQGINGNASASYAQGVYFAERSSLLLSYKKNRLGLTLTASDMQAKGFADWVERQYIVDPATAAVTGTTRIHSTPWERFGITTGRLAADYSLTERAAFGASFRATYHPNTSAGYIYSERNDRANGTTYNEATNPESFIRKDVVANTYFSYKPGKASTLDVNADYLAYSNDAWQDVGSTDYNSLMQPLSAPFVLHSRQPSLINVASLKVDYTCALGTDIKLESGAKSSYVVTDNDARFSVLQAGQWRNDTARTNRFRYKEHISAAYAALAKSFSAKWDVRIGLRAEQTTATGMQYIHNTGFDRNYLSLFPTAFIGYKADTNNQFELNYGRRIDRPAYQLLNPFINYSFQYSYKVGNPYLLPQYTNSIELKHSYRNMLITAVSLSAAADVISDILVSDKATGRVYSTSANNAAGKTADAYVVFNKDVARFLSLNASAYAFYTRYSGVLAGSKVTRGGVGYSFHLSAQADCGKGWKTELNGYYNNDNVTSLIQAYGPQLYTSVGASKKIRERLLVKLLFNDPFYLCRLKVYNELPGFRSDAVFRNATQQVVLELSYTFGKRSTQEQHVNTVDESRRIKMN